MNRADIEKGLKEGWLVPDEEDGWYRFCREFIGYEESGRAVFVDNDRRRYRVRVVAEGTLPVR